MAARAALVALGIHADVAAVLAAHGITELYPPQADAWQAAKGGRNVIVAVPTASGKSLVAYLALLHNFLRTGRKGMYIVPLRALAAEKYEELRDFRTLGVTVAVATGDLDETGAKRLGRADIIVCTSEKADSLLRHRVGWVDQVGCVVADEVHLLHDASRGPTLEVLLSRFHALYPDTQLVGLSATIANADALARWLDAALVQSTWRPVELRTGTYHGDELAFVGQPPRRLEAAKDPVASLAADVIESGGQCLVFCSTRRGAEAQAQRLGGVVRDLLSPDETGALERAAATLVDAETDSPTGRKLRKLVQAGVAYHTAGLDARQRKFLEDQFRARRIKVLCATPTLAAGVNTPARRVVIRDLTRFEAGMGSRPIPVMEVQQMMGRAGRPRYDPIGEAVILCKSQEHAEATRDEYLLGTPEPISSKLAADAALRIHTLATVAGGYCGSTAALRTWLASTFWAQETDDWILRERLDDVLAFLADHGFVEHEDSRQRAPPPTSARTSARTPGTDGFTRASELTARARATDDAPLRATLFGKRTSDLYIDPLSALRMRAALESGRAPTTYGLLQVAAGCPDIYPLYLRQNDDWVAAAVTQHYDELLVPDDARDGEALASYAKTAMLLADWCNEVDHETLEDRYQVGPGDIRMRVDAGQWLVHAFRELARALRPEWQRDLTLLGERLQYGIREELLPLIQLRAIGRVRARTLHAHGFKRPHDLAQVPASRLAALPGFGPQLARDLLRQVGGRRSAASSDRADDEERDSRHDVAESAAGPKGQVPLSEFTEEPA